MQRVRRAGIAALLLIAAPLSAAQQVWFVPWQVLEPGIEAKPSLLAVYWIPASPEELRRSDLLTSRMLATYSSKCVGMHVVRLDDAERINRFSSTSLPIVVLADGNREVSRLPNGNGILRAVEVEAMVRAEFDVRAAAVEQALDDARRLLEQNDEAGAVALYEQVERQRCAFPREAKAARKALRRIGK